MMETLASLQPTKTIHLDKLFQIDHLQSLLMECTSLIGAPSTVITASQFSKRYSSYLLSSSLTQLLTTGQFPSIQKYQDCIELNYHTGDFELYIQENALQCLPEYCTKRQIDDYIQHYFAEHLLPLWTSLSQLTGIKMDVLWENTFIYIAWTCLNKVNTSNAYDNFIYITQEADGSLFHLRENPFTTFTAGEVRNKCCFYFMLPNSTGVKCKNCPLDCKK